MLLEMRVPSPGESISEVEIAEWLVENGDYVEKDQAIAEIDSDKATLELPAEESGTIKIVVADGETVAVGDIVCIIDTSVKGDLKVKTNKEKIVEAKKEVLKSDKFLVEAKNTKIDILEIHNRPNYINFLDNNSISKKILYFHNDPQSMLGSRTINERINLLNKTERIVFNSNWSKMRFLENLPNYIDYKKIIVIPQSTSKTDVSFDKKKNLISFIGKLNTSKGYDVFGKSILKILDEYPDWKSIVIGDEPREKLIFKHKNLQNLGYKNNDLPITELYSKLQLSLPIYPEMKLNDVVYISKIINNFNLR